MRRSFAAPLLLAGASMLCAGSCRGIVEGEPVDAAAELCALLKNCYPTDEGCGALGDSVEPQTWQAFLDAFDPKGCLASCAEARACADQAPFCGDAECSSDQQCCGWSRGTAACGSSGACCRPNGIACDDGSQCCEGECVHRFCGGYQCLDVGAACSGPAQCCTKLCIDGACALDACSMIDEPCATGEDCCPLLGMGAESGNTTGVICQDGSCQVDDGGPPICGQEQDSCDRIGCCEGLDCLAIPQGGSYCLVPGCTPQGFECTATDECCAPLECDVVFGSCEFPQPECAYIGEDCSQELCCEGATCVEYQCVESSCTTIDCHGICDVGGPMTPDCLMDAAEFSCAQDIVYYDPICQCEGWDSTCVEEVYYYCGLC